MTLAEKFGLGLQTTGLGILVVFIALFLIVLIIILLSKILNGKKKEKPVIENTLQTKDAVAAPMTGLGDENIIAVLSAAVAAYMAAGGATGNNGLVVRSYRRIGSESAWAQAGRDAQIYNKF